jgi:hypothetical protein
VKLKRLLVFERVEVDVKLVVDKLLHLLELAVQKVDEDGRVGHYIGVSDF